MDGFGYEWETFNEKIQDGHMSDRKNLLDFIYPLTDDFFNELIEGRVTAARRMLQRVKEEVDAKERSRGYVNALEGMLLASSSRRDRVALINQIHIDETSKFTRTFSRQSKNRMLNEFDRGFFTAWVDYMRHFKNSNKK